ncbi:hypothetical protein P872_08695 [Rhodonellum psychrophilum GCM71 = DSM 17998]|uniref:Uncharacterized protein n=2 Tax=Rhodonellum TaxID=336827 RepID=U5BZE9_9BACT|nr:hypothetical protein P872_08695 [Rhodonellum psychrophilum GCM71 = DSM 17998]SDZ07581.1 hypothetical protein SAMN05444412_105180 [Rhodonellum ikkaensis]
MVEGQETSRLRFFFYVNGYSTTPTFPILGLGFLAFIIPSSLSKMG